MKICGDIRNKLFTSVNNTDVVIAGDKLSPVLLPAISIAGVVGIGD
jgi:hypothetical protein